MQFGKIHQFDGTSVNVFVAYERMGWVTSATNYTLRMFSRHVSMCLYGSLQVNANVDSWSSHGVMDYFNSKGLRCERTTRDMGGARETKFV